MKSRIVKNVLALVLAVSLVVVAAPVMADNVNWSKGSGELTSSAAAYSNPCYITAVQVITDGSNDAVVTLWDSTSSTSTVSLKIAEFTVVGADNTGGRVWNYPRHCFSGIYVSISGTGASAIVEYIPAP